MKVMILAAGRGQRMRPLTDETPKPLLSVRGKPLIVHLIEKLARNGFTDMVINISHLASQFPAVLGNGENYGVNIQYSLEPNVLETGGGIIKALPLLGNEPFLVVSSDIWTDYPFTQLRERLKSGTSAHIVLVPNPSFHPTGDFGLENGRLSYEHIPKYTNGNIGVFSPELFKNLEPHFVRLFTLLAPTISDKQISGEIYHGEWDNIGTIAQLNQINQSG